MGIDRIAVEVDRIVEAVDRGVMLVLVLVEEVVVAVAVVEEVGGGAAVDRIVEVGQGNMVLLRLPLRLVVRVGGQGGVVAGADLVVDQTVVGMLQGGVGMQRGVARGVVVPEEEEEEEMAAEIIRTVQEAPVWTRKDIERGITVDEEREIGHREVPAERGNEEGGIVIPAAVRVREAEEAVADGIIIGADAVPVGNVRVPVKGADLQRIPPRGNKHPLGIMATNNEKATIPTGIEWRIMRLY